MAAAAGKAVSSLKVCEVEKRVSGDPSTDAWRLFYVNKEGVPVSALHDIPLHADSGDAASPVFNFVCEIPRYRNAKLEICLKERFNPIKQDIKRGKLRFVHNVLPFQGYLFNYGAFPQTWESPSFKHPETNCFGDNDPLDVCEIGQATAQVGDIMQVKVGSGE
jgi:inorganic pyrophosphatase